MLKRQISRRLSQSTKCYWKNCKVRIRSTKMLTIMNQSICRCCLLENPTLTYNIFVNNLRQDLAECTPNVNIEPDDGLPDVICELCLSRVRDAIEFRQRCIETDRVLRQRYDETSKAIEAALGMEILDHIEQEMSDLVQEYVIEDDRTSCQSIEKIEMDRTTRLPDFDTLVFNNSMLCNDEFSLCSLPPSTLNTPIPEHQNTVLDELIEQAINNPAFDSTLRASESTEVENTMVQIKARTQNKSKTSPKSLHVCTECEKKFTRNFQLKLHMISVHNLGDGLQYQCENCQKTFASRHSLNYHSKSIHSSERPFQCEHCDRRFVLRTQLASHMRIHTGNAKPRIHECIKCGKHWPTKSDLRTHMRTHNPQMVRPFKCDSCDKSFYTRGHLNSHILVHTGEKPYACAFCEKSYQSVGNLNNHLVRHHPDIIAGQTCPPGVILET